MPKKPRQHRPVHRRRNRVAFVELKRALVLQRRLQLDMQILPLSHAGVGQKMFSAKLASMVLGSQLLPLLMKRVPQIE